MIDPLFQFVFLLNLHLLDQNSTLLSTFSADISETTTRETTSKGVSTITVSTTTPRKDQTTTIKGIILISETSNNLQMFKMYVLIRTK